MHRITRTIAAVLVTVALVVVTPVSASAADPPDFTPSPSKWKAWLINVTSSVLGGALPSGWRAEQIANQHKFNFGAWDGMNANLGIDGVRTDANGNMVGIKWSNKGQGTYEDVVIANLEESFTKTSAKGGTGNKPFAAPATRPLTFAKTVGGGLAAFTAFEVGNYLGAAGTNLVGGWFGFDAQGVVCGQTSDGSILSGGLRYLSGQDCAMWSLPQGFEPNGDAGVEYGSLTVGAATYSYEGLLITPAGYTYNMFCYSRSGSAHTLPPGTDFYIRNKAGGYSATGFALSSGGSAGRCTAGLYQIAAWRADAPQYNHAVSPAVFVRNVSTGAVVASMSETSGDPDRYQRCTVTYTDNSTLSSNGDTYRESSGSVRPAICPGTPSGKTPRSVRVTDNQTGAGSGSTPSQTVYEEDVTDEYQDWWEEFPECRTGACQLDLIKLGTSPQSCFDLEEGCVGWFEDSAKADNYLCRYGVHDVALSECNVYASLFEPGRIVAGAAYADPSTGQWSGGQSSPKAGQTAMAAGIQDPELIRSCDLSDVGFDPIGWVVRPIQCAFEWAFVPRPTVVEASFAGANQTWEDKPPYLIAQAASNVSLSPSASGCSIPIEFLGISGNAVDVCSGPMAAVPIASRLMTSAIFLILVFGIVRRQIAGMVGYNLGQG